MRIDDFKKVKIEAMKAHDKDAVAALNVVINKLMLAGIEKKAAGEEMTDADVTKILQKTVNELAEERVASLDRQLETVKKYLPKLLSAEEIKEIIEKLDDKTVPSVMKHFKTNYAGKVDMKLVGEVLKTL